MRLRLESGNIALSRFRGVDRNLALNAAVRTDKGNLLERAITDRGVWKCVRVGRRAPSGRVRFIARRGDQSGHSDARPFSGAADSYCRAGLGGG